MRDGAKRLTQLADQGGVSEIMITTMMHEHEDRRRSYELLAEVFGLGAGNNAGAESAAR